MKEGEFMDIREELDKIINSIDDLFDRIEGKSNDYKSGAYEIFLDSLKADLGTINEILELREKRK